MNYRNNPVLPGLQPFFPTYSDAPTTKQCNWCGRTRGAEFFQRDSSQKDGLQRTCRPCRKKRQLAKHEWHYLRPLGDEEPLFYTSNCSAIELAGKWWLYPDEYLARYLCIGPFSLFMEARRWWQSRDSLARPWQEYLVRDTALPVDSELLDLPRPGKDSAAPQSPLQK